MKYLINDTLGEVTVKINAARNPEALLILAHGAGAGMHHPFMERLAERLADSGISVFRFNFPYMEAGRRSPGSPKNNIAAWESIISQVKKEFSGLPVFLSGKSYGGRIASHVLAQNPGSEARGIIYFGFPLHAPGKDGKERAAHLTDVGVPQLFLQGERDKLANINLMREVVEELPEASLKEFELADHSFKVPKSAGITEDEMSESLARDTAEWIDKILGSK